MKFTLLEMVQDIHNDLDLDEVNSIDDTVESAQVAQIIKTTYFALMSNRNWPHLKQTISLTPSGTTDRPTHMRLPEGVKELLFINYNCVKEDETRKRYKQVKWLEPDAFLRKSNLLNNDNTNVDIVLDVTGVELLIQNNKQPEYFTSFDDQTLVFDSYDVSIDSTLQNSKVQAMAYVMPAWESIDSFVPDLPEEAFIGLLEEAKSRAALKLKQEADQKSEQEATRQRRWLSQKAWQVKGGIQYPNYGRNNGKYNRDVTFEHNREY
jgi:hypothetical protein